MVESLNYVKNAYDVGSAGLLAAAGILGGFVAYDAATSGGAAPLLLGSGSSNVAPVGAGIKKPIKKAVPYVSRKAPLKVSKGGKGLFTKRKVYGRYPGGGPGSGHPFRFRKHPSWYKRYKMVYRPYVFKKPTRFVRKYRSIDRIKYAKKYLGRFK